jgi:hypothetical protein
VENCFHLRSFDDESTYWNSLKSCCDIDTHFSFNGLQTHHDTTLISTVSALSHRKEFLSLFYLFSLSSVVMFLSLFFLVRRILGVGIVNIFYVECVSRACDIKCVWWVYQCIENKKNWKIKFQKFPLNSFLIILEFSILRAKHFLKLTLHNLHCIPMEFPSKQF